jgi:hypothetical protein
MAFDRAQLLCCERLRFGKGVCNMRDTLRVCAQADLISRSERSNQCDGSRDALLATISSRHCCRRDHSRRTEPHHVFRTGKSFTSIRDGAQISARRGQVDRFEPNVFGVDDSLLVQPEHRSSALVAAVVVKIKRSRQPAPRPLSRRRGGQGLPRTAASTRSRKARGLAERWHE